MPHLDPTSLRLVIVFAVFAGVLALGTWGITYGLRKMREQESTDPDLVDQLQAAYEEGEIDEEEFRRVRAVLSRRSGPPDAIPPGVLPRAARPPGGAADPAGPDATPTAPSGDGAAPTPGLPGGDVQGPTAS